MILGSLAGVRRTSAIGVLVHRAAGGEPMASGGDRNSGWVADLVGITVGALPAVAAGVSPGLLRPESASVLRPWWR